MGKTMFYTGKGDRGDTGRLAGQERLPKSGLLIDTIGTIDEATAAIGMARALAQSSALAEALPTVQRQIYRLMSHISATGEARQRYSGLSEEDVAWLEKLIAQLETGLPELHDFVLPGDSPAGAAFHVARTTVRRAERRLVTFVETEPDVGAPNLAYLNRLSSLMFVAALQEDLLAGKRSRLAQG